MSDVSFSYPGSAAVFRLKSLTIEAGEAVLLTGSSGSGKSTLLGLLCGILQASSGEIFIAGEAMSRASGKRRDRLRADNIGYVFQSFNLIPFLSARENVLLAGEFSARRSKCAGRTKKDRQRYAESLLTEFNVEDTERRASSLSVGQQQRVAAARALFGEPPLLVADEPTAALDTSNRDTLLGAFVDKTKRRGSSLLMVSHDPDVAKFFDRSIEISSIARWE
ncbi:MAG: ABC transporter ATP-binding protein [Pseudomonadota bacterium]